ncbi:MAG: biotin/lipoyl-binding protein [Bacteroidales bacterium]|jgi:biotin carboxyl carrier protein|nr:biotin/lipoyl-binding protein [Bacteroidales bacterium]MBR4688457.1 biotin/lipoyl-binding protein [Bacteroidales bacterium]
MKEYKFKIGGKEYNVTVNPKEGKFFDVTVNGATYEVEAENAPAAAPVAQPAAAPVQAAAAAPAAPAAKPAGAGEKLASPLPGVIIEISVKEGQQVKAGQKVAILEAMKMENEIPAPKDGTITEIHVHKGDTLQEGDPVVTIA